MTATLTPPHSTQTRAGGVPVDHDDSSRDAGAEQRRWVIPLVLSFTWSAAFFAAAIGTEKLWLLAPAGLGIGLIIIGFVYLGLTSDSNGAQ